MTAPTPFKIETDPRTIERIRWRVADTIWPKEPANGGWGYGANLSYIKELCIYWANEYDWWEWEARLNAFPQFKADVEVEGATLNLHFYHVKSPRADATPLILAHGWPGSVFEFLHLIEPLTNPVSDDDPAFHVVVPSLPGYAWSEAPANPISPRRVAAYFNTLMTDVLGYDSYLAQGGDWGGLITCSMAHDWDACAAAHINIMGWLAGVPAETEEEKAHAAKGEAARFMEGAYFNMHIAKPMSLAVGLEDSPSGWAAWVVEKMHGWSDTKGDDIESAYTKDQLLTNLMTYLVTGSVGTGLWLYRGLMEDPYGEPLAPGATLDKPMGIARLPFEVPIYAIPPRSQAEKSFTNIVQWTEYEAGGHFAALEQPEALLKDVRGWAKKLG